MTTALTAALRACAAGFYPSEAGTALLISHGGFLDRPGFGAFIHAGTSITDGITEMAEIDWQAAIIALHDGQPAPIGRRAAHPPARRQHRRRRPRRPARRHPRPGRQEPETSHHSHPALRRAAPGAPLASQAPVRSRRPSGGT